MREHPLRVRALSRGAVAASVQFLRNGGKAAAAAAAVAMPTTPDLTLSPAVETTSAPRDEQAILAEVIDLTNQARAAGGLQPLVASAALTRAAAIHSQDMARLGQMVHDIPGAPNGSLAERAAFVGYRYRSLGENIAYNQAGGAAVVAAWLASPPHHENMLSADFTEIGVGVAWSRRGEPYYTMELGRPA
jgi:uncharacterized protein YkwD